MINEVFASTLITALTKKIVESSSNKILTKSNKIIKSLTNKTLVQNYCKKTVNKVFTFRTLTHGDKNVYLDEIYYPMHISHESLYDTETIEITDGTTLRNNEAICIIGIAGQGKTTIMRKLFLEELVKKERLPFFINLRQIKNYENLSPENLLLDHLNSNGIKCDIEDILKLCSTTKISFFFDGFDEVPLNQRAFALETINQSFEKLGCNAIVTTRPETEITRTPGYNIYNVEFLHGEEIFDILKKRVPNKDAYTQLKSILESKKFLTESIRTPILLDIFIVISASLKDDPKSISDYYDGLFTALMYRHDLIKNLTRTKKSDLPDRILEKCFSFFGFFTLINGKSDFTRSEIVSVFKKCLDLMKLNCPPEYVTDDILDGSNIIVKDGWDNYVYVHRSIQEYFAAKCIANMDETSKDKVLNNLTKVPSHDINTNLMVMLNYLDSFSFIKSYVIPRLEQKNLIDDGLVIKISKPEIVIKIDNWHLGISKINNRCNFLSPNGSHNTWRDIMVIEEVCSFLNHGKRLSVSDDIVSLLLFNDTEEIAKIVLKEHYAQKPHNSTSSIEALEMESEYYDIYKTKDENTHEESHSLRPVIVKFGNIKDTYKNYHKIESSIYENYIQLTRKLNAHIKENYHNKIESDLLLKNIIENINFE